MTLQTFFAIGAAGFLCNLSPAQLRPGFPRLPGAQAAIYGAVGDGIADDTAAIQNAINGLPSGAVLDFGSGKTYLVSQSLILKPNAAYTGASTIRMSGSARPGTQIAILQYEMSDNVSISGLTLDANGIGGGISLAINGGGSVPAQNIQITHVTFMNTNPHPSGGGDDAIYDPVGISNALIADDLFVNCGGGILLSDPGNLSIVRNEFDNIFQDDAIYLLFPQNPFPYGAGLVVSANHGKQIARIAIEMWGPGGSVVQAPLISNNSFQGWSNQSYGISVMVGTHAQILSNTLANGAGPFGIELGAPFSTVQGNTISGFATGIVVHDAHDSTIDRNNLTAQSDTGLLLSSAAGSRINLRISNNQVQDPQFKGLSAQDNNWANSTVTGNTISRRIGAWNGDNIQTQFQAIAFYPPGGPVSITKNSVIESGTVIPGLRFVGVAVNGGQGANSGTVYDSNTITSNQPQPAGIGFYVNTLGGLDNVTVTNNTFQNLALVTSGQPSPGVIYQNNVAINCLLSGVIPLAP
jgi:hypothetical protein